jgi:Zn finger protein HypA/HybF involved in hydrogenase expression
MLHLCSLDYVFTISFDLGIYRIVSTPLIIYNMKYTKEQFKEACKQAKSYRNVMSQLGLKEAGGNYATIKKKIVEFQIDISHFTGKGWNKDLNFKPNPPLPISQILVSNSNYQSHKLRKRLLKEGYFEYKCYSCNMIEWVNQPITLELEHIDGNHTNNQIENLTLLCPNCHALTSTWRGRKLKLGSALTSALSVKCSPNLIESQ